MMYLAEPELLIRDKEHALGKIEDRKDARPGT